MDDYINDTEDLLKDNKFDEAEEKAREWLLQNLDDLKAKVTLARVLFLESKEAESETLISEILEVDDQNTDALSLLAFIREWQKRFVEAKDILLKLLPLSRKKAWVNLRIGKVLANRENERRDHEEALKYYKAAVTSENPPAEAFQALAYAEHDSRSVYILQHGISRHPDNVDLWFDLCRQLYHNEDYLKCIETIEKAEAKGITIDDGAWVKAFAYYYLERYEDALKVIRTVERQDGIRGIVEETIEGLLNYLSGDYQNAEKILLKVIEEDIGNSLNYNGHILLTSVYFNSSKVKEGEKTFEEMPVNSEDRFRSPLILETGIWLSLRMEEHYLEMLKRVISASTSPYVFLKAKYFYSAYKYSGYMGTDLSTDELREVRDDLLMFRSESDTVPISVLWDLYSVSADLGEWINAVDYYLEYTAYKESPPAIQENVLEGISKNQKQFEKLLALMEKHLVGGYAVKPVRKTIEQLISFFFSKGKFMEVIKLVEKFNFNQIMETDSVFNVAYSYVQIGKEDLAKNYYRTYLEQKGNNSAFANNLALLEEKDGNLVEAERLLQLALEWSPALDTAKTNHKRVIERLQKENEK